MKPYVLVLSCSTTFASMVTWSIIATTCAPKVALSTCVHPHRSMTVKWFGYGAKSGNLGRVMQYLPLVLSGLRFLSSSVVDRFAAGCAPGRSWSRPTPGLPTWFSPFLLLTTGMICQRQVSAKNSLDSLPAQKRTCTLNVSPHAWDTYASHICLRRSLHLGRNCLPHSRYLGFTRLVAGDDCFPADIFNHSTPGPALELTPIPLYVA